MLSIQKLNNVTILETENVTIPETGLHYQFRNSTLLQVSILNVANSLTKQNVTNSKFQHCYQFIKVVLNYQLNIASTGLEA